MESKYYTPEIEEFHIGFEFEGREFDSKRWLPKEFKDGQSVELFEDNRVKCLDEEDIESLGWILKRNEVGEFDFELNNYYLKFWSNTSEHYTTNIYIKQLTGLGLHCFKGTIKNKSELKKVMEQLDIK